jgi:non-specific serine/threonine protein kinase
MERILPKSRLLTLTGPGGIGKTRLATQAAGRYVEDYSDGVWLVEFGALDRDSSIQIALADVLGLDYSAQGPTASRLAAHLGSRRVLLVLDNCEHRLPAVAEIVERLLTTCPDLKVLATSREALGVTGETIFRIEPLSLSDARSNNQVAPTSDASALFCDRAIEALGSFTPDVSDLKSIGRICRVLEGIPLAIELAAARLAVLSIAQLESGLAERFQLLAGGGRTLTARQQTLRGAIDWSYDLLSVIEQQVLDRLSVFAGSFTLEGAAAVCSGGFIPPETVVDLVYNLVHKSLVIPPSPGEGHRYHMLETIREFAQQKLGESDSRRSAQRAHRDWYLGLANQAGSDWNESENGRWIEQLELERDNLLSAANYAHEEGDLEVSNRLGSALGHFQRARLLHATGAGLQQPFSDPSAAHPTVSERPPGPYRISGSN